MPNERKARGHDDGVPPTVRAGGASNVRASDIDVATLDVLPDPVVLTDARFHVQAANRAFRDTFELDAESIEETQFFTLVETDFAPLVDAQVKERLRAGQTFHGRVRQRGRFGGWRSCELRVKPVSTAGDAVAGLLFVLRDITSLEEVLVEGFELDRQRARALFAARLAHDFNNVLSVIVLSLDGCAATGVRAPELLDIREAAQQGQAIALELMESTTTTTRAPVPCDLERATRNTCRLVQRTFRATVDIQLDIERRLPKPVVGPGVVEQVLVRLLENAHEASAPTATISVRVFRENDAIVLEVSDDGHGMEGDVLARAHDPFFSTKTPPVHLGLGLADVARIIRSFDGTFRLGVPPTGGTVARVSIPLTGA